MNFWCSATDAAWTWAWQPYVGVWLLCGALLAWYFRATRDWNPIVPGERRRRATRFVLGVLALWVGADWPVGALGAGYLLSVHTLQYLIFVHLAAPLMLWGIPIPILRRKLGGRIRPLARFLARPIVSFLLFSAILLASHIPQLVDGLATSQLGSFGINMSWLFSGFLFWWQVIGPLDEFQPLSYQGKLVFLLLNVFIPTVPATFLTYARYPIYRLYELAPPVWGITAVEDQQIAGVLMKVGGGLIIFGVGTVLFFKWQRVDSNTDDLDPPRSGSGDSDGGDGGNVKGPSAKQPPVLIGS